VERKKKKAGEGMPLKRVFAMGQVGRSPNKWREWGGSALKNPKKKGNQQKGRRGKDRQRPGRVGLESGDRKKPSRKK